MLFERRGDFFEYQSTTIYGGDLLEETQLRHVQFPFHKLHIKGGLGRPVLGMSGPRR